MSRNSPAFAPFGSHSADNTISDEVAVHPKPIAEVNMTNFTTRLLAATLCTLLPTAMLAESRGTSSNLQADLSDMAAALGVTEAHTQVCMPAPLQVQVDVHPDLAEITACLKEEKSSLTSTEVNDAWKT